MIGGASGTDLVIAAVGISAVIGAGYQISKAVKSIRAWVEGLADRAKVSFSDAVDSSATGHLVKYHFGPNGETPALHKRVTDNQATELEHHRQNTAKFDAVFAELEKVSKAQKAAAAAVVVAEGVEIERRADTE